MKFRFPDKPTESTPTLFDGMRTEDWVCQDKIDGWRCLIAKGITLSGGVTPPKPIMLSRMGRLMQFTRAKGVDQIQTVVDLLDKRLPDGTVYLLT